ncbi:MAG: T9SS type A sorting domain-containing protein [Chitinophagaceae bacterium]
MNFELANAGRGVAETNLIVNKKIADPVNKLTVSAFPNPTQTFFNLKVESKSNELVQVKIFDINGRQLQYIPGTPGEVLKIGSKLAPGTYLVETRQGNERSIIKIIKQ